MVSSNTSIEVPDVVVDTAIVGSSTAGQPLAAVFQKSQTIFDMFKDVVKHYEIEFSIHIGQLPL